MPPKRKAAASKAAEEKGEAIPSVSLLNQAWCNSRNK